MPVWPGNIITCKWTPIPRNDCFISVSATEHHTTFNDVWLTRITSVLRSGYFKAYTWMLIFLPSTLCLLCGFVLRLLLKIQVFSYSTPCWLVFTDISTCLSAFIFRFKTSRINQTWNSNPHYQWLLTYIYYLQKQQAFNNIINKYHMCRF